MPRRRLRLAIGPTAWPAPRIPVAQTRWEPLPQAQAVRTGRACAIEGGSGCGTRTPTENPDCCSGCRGCSCYGTRNERWPDYCSKSRRATPGGTSPGRPAGRNQRADYATNTNAPPEKNRGALRAMAATRPNSEQRLRWGTHTPTENPERSPGRRGSCCRETPRARRPDR